MVSKQSGAVPFATSIGWLLILLIAVILGFAPRQVDAATAVDVVAPIGRGTIAEQRNAQTPYIDIGAGTFASSTLYLPQLAHHVQLATRLGFGSTISSPLDFPEIESLRAGWYLDWTVSATPAQPNNMEFAQMIRLHQDLTCPVGSLAAHNRTLCPYVVPYSYTYTPDAATIQEVAQARPGSLWLLGNEIERRDWPGGGHQDEILPELYALAYHELYTLIKTADPQAKVAIGGVIQTTPLRMKYLDRVLNHYKLIYGTKMPVDVWNIHTFILPEKSGYWGADIPVGLTETEGAYLFHLGSSGEVLPIMPEHLDGNLIAQQIRNFRQWMKDRGEQEKPLIITEYSVLLPNWVLGLPDNDSQSVIDFMLWSFDHFLTAKDCDLGYTADDCRLVQRWVWYSLNDNKNFNEHQAYFNPDTTAITPTGEAARQFAKDRMAELAVSPY